jgi:hypothetical protein
MKTLLRQTVMLTAAAVLLLAAGCASMQPSPLNASLAGTTRYLCCNVHYETTSLSDANYYVGTTLPAGTPVQIDAVRARSVTFTALGSKFTLDQSYGAQQEPFETYLNKVLVIQDPNPVIARQPKAVQEAIRDSRVENGMTKEQVLFSLGYPPTHETSSTQSLIWKYWRNRFATFIVRFDANDKVSSLDGAPTTGVRIEPDKPAAAPAKAQGSKSKKK